MNPANSISQTDDRGPVTRISVRYIHAPPFRLAVKHSTPNRFAGRGRAGEAFRFAGDDPSSDGPCPAISISQTDSAPPKA